MWLTDPKRTSVGRTVMVEMLFGDIVHGEVDSRQMSQSSE